MSRRWLAATGCRHVKRPAARSWAKRSARRSLPRMAPGSYRSASRAECGWSRGVRLMAVAADRAPDWVAGGTPEPLRSQLLETLGEDRVLTRALDLVKYASDASPYRLIPQAVAMPHDVGDVVKLLAVARRKRTPLVVRAGGTSLNGQSQPGSHLARRSTPPNPGRSSSSPRRRPSSPTASGSSETSCAGTRSWRGG